MPALAVRAADARREADQTGVAPEVLASVSGDALMIDDAEHPCGTVTLVEQLAQTRGLTVERGAVAPDAPGLFLISDEHGIVPAAGNESVATIEFLAQSYAKLLAKSR